VSFLHAAEFGRTPQSDLQRALGHAVRERQTRTGLTQQHLPNQSRIHFSYLSGLEPDRRTPSFDERVRRAQHSVVGEG
jgi:hypothetical protein